MPQTSVTNHDVTFDSVFKELQKWRNNKGSGAGSSRSIPNSIWEQIFALEQSSYKGTDLRRMFVLNALQYKKKYEELATPQKIAAPSLEPFAEVSIPVKLKNQPLPERAKLKAVEDIKSEITQIKSSKKVSDDFSAIKTIIVELVRPDGYKLRIHTTNDSVDLVMASFMNQKFNP